jgi:hypothetical protein
MEESIQTEQIILNNFLKSNSRLTDLPNRNKPNIIDFTWFGLNSKKNRTDVDFAI